MKTQILIKTKSKKYKIVIENGSIHTYLKSELRTDSKKFIIVDSKVSKKIYKIIKNKNNVFLITVKGSEKLKSINSYWKIISKLLQKKIDRSSTIISIGGGTVGDIESLPFLEAIRQFSNDIKRKNSLFIHLTLVPFLKASGELKTKPTQHSVKELRSLGIQPDIIICRSERKIPKAERKKKSLFCNVSIENVIETIDVRTIYEAPISFHKEKLDERVLSYFNIKNKKSPDLTKWKSITSKVLNPKKDVNIGIIGKYVNLKDAYKSLDEALIHGGISNNL